MVTDPNVQLSVALTPIEVIGATAVNISMLAAAAAAIISALRVQFSPDDAAVESCIRWRRAVGLTLLIWCAVAPLIELAPELPLILTIALFDCHLAIRCSPNRHFPTARARWRSQPS